MRIALAALLATVALAFAVLARAQGPAGCPPGLAAKGCVPPGQAKKFGGYAPPPRVAYPPAVVYLPSYPDYYPPSRPGVNLNITLPSR